MQAQQSLQIHPHRTPFVYKCIMETQQEWRMIIRLDFMEVVTSIVATTVGILSNMGLEFRGHSFTSPFDRVQGWHEMELANVARHGCCN